MKNIRLLAPMILAGLVALYAIGCGSATGGGSSGGGTKSFVAVDPYITNAIFYADYNDNYQWDAGEPSSEVSGTDGGFNFSDPITMDCTIRGMVNGEHNGVPYSITISKAYSTLETGTQYITPLTTLASNGITPEVLADIIEEHAGITIDAALIENGNPMLGILTMTLDNFDEQYLENLRAAIAAYSIVSIINSVESMYGYQITAASLEAHGEQLAIMGDELRNSLNRDLIISIEARMNESPIPLPAVTAYDVARTTIAITDHVIYMVVTSPGNTWEPTGADIEEWATRLGMRFYFLDHKSNGNIQLALNSHQVLDPYTGITIEASYINNAKSFKLDVTGEVERVDL